jgi:hypothetical protein
LQMRTPGSASRLPRRSSKPYVFNFRCFG